MFALNSYNNFTEKVYDVDKEPVAATLFTTGNGYMGVRGSFEEFGSLRVQGAFVRGFIDEIVEVCEPFANNEYMKKYYLDEEKLKSFEKQDSCVNMHDFLFVRIVIGNQTFYPWEGEVLAWERTLDSTTGTYLRKVLWKDPEGKTTEITFTRFASFDNEHLYCQKVEVHPVDHNKSVTFISGVDTYRKTSGQFITKTDSIEVTGENISHRFHAVNKYGFSAEYYIKNKFPKGEVSGYEENGVYGVKCKAEKSDVYVLEKFTYVAINRDSDKELSEFVKENIKNIDFDFAKQYELHKTAYEKYFSTMDIKIVGDDEADGYLRFASYHTAISAAMHDDVHGVAAKGLTGERYNQFVWWDCEIHQLPFFIQTAPKTAKYLLLYRYRMLEQSRKNAENVGLKGAKYAFCSSVNGDERVWQYARHPFMQVHINSDIPMGILNYYKWTDDKEFLTEYGFEMMTECLRYWVSRVTEKNGRYEILCVTGTDEHHPYVDNDAYTNYCVGYIFKEYLRLAEKLGYNVEKSEKEKFKDISEKLYLPEAEGGMIPQFDGYFSLSRTLEEAGGGSLKQFQMKKSGLYHKSQVIKQPDVALLYTFADVGLDKSAYALNWDYYEQMCETSSSLTFPVHAVASIDNGRVLSFYNYFMKTLKIDVDDIHGVAWQGVHSGCLAGGYLSVVRGVFGVKATDEVLVIAPNRMPLWKEVKAKVIYHGNEIEFSAVNGKVYVKLLSGSGCNVEIYGEKQSLEKGNVKEIVLK